MKILVITLIMLTSTLFAQAAPPVVIAEIFSVSDTIQSISLSNAGEVTIIALDALDDVKPVKFKLAFNNKFRIVSRAQQLGGIETETELREGVCSGYPNVFERPLLQVLNPKTNLMETILSPSGCEHLDYTHPKTSAELQSAEVLRDLLIALSEQHLG